MGATWGATMGATLWGHFGGPLFVLTPLEGGLSPLGGFFLARGDLPAGAPFFIYLNPTPPEKYPRALPPPLCRRDHLFECTRAGCMHPDACACIPARFELSSCLQFLSFVQSSIRNENNMHTCNFQFSEAGCK